MKSSSHQTQSRIILTVGPQTLREDKLANYLVRQHNALAVEVGRFAREVARNADDSALPVMHDVDMQELAEYGSTHLMKQLIDACTQLEELAKNVIVIIGVKTAAELAVFKNHFGDNLLLVLEESQSITWDEPDGASRDSKDYRAPRLLETPVEIDVVLGATTSERAYQQQVAEKIIPYLSVSHEQDSATAVTH